MSLLFVTMDNVTLSGPFPYGHVRLFGVIRQLERRWSHEWGLSDCGFIFAVVGLKN